MMLVSDFSKAGEMILRFYPARSAPSILVSSTVSSKSLAIVLTLVSTSNVLNSHCLCYRKRTWSCLEADAVNEDAFVLHHYCQCCPHVLTSVLFMACCH